MLPLATPGLITISIINFVDIWNEYLLALMLMRDETRMPVSVGLYTLKGTPMAAQDWTALMAGVVMVVVPTILVYVLLQKRIEKGLTLGAFKG
jgi:N-acetylglucosamine transport system permease protein